METVPNPSRIVGITRFNFHFLNPLNVSRMSLMNYFIWKRLGKLLLCLWFLSFGWQFPDVPGNWSGVMPHNGEHSIEQFGL